MSSIKRRLLDIQVDSSLISDIQDKSVIFIEKICKNSEDCFFIDDIHGTYPISIFVPKKINERVGVDFLRSSCGSINYYDASTYNNPVTKKCSLLMKSDAYYYFKTKKKVRK